MLSGCSFNPNTAAVRSMELNMSENMMMVYPARYNLNIPDNDWGWNKMEHVLASCRNMAAKYIKGTNKEFIDALDLAQRFAGLVLLHAASSKGDFFFSRDGVNLEFIPIGSLHKLNLNNIYVPEGWVRSVLKVIKCGGARVFYGKLESPGLGETETVLFSKPDVSELFQIPVD